MIRVLIVDDHPLVARGVEATLQGESDIEVVGIAGTALEAEEIAKGEAPDVVMMDFRLPDRSGAEAAAAIRSQRPQIAVVFLTADVSDDAIGQAVQSGAVGFLLKGDAPTEPRTVHTPRGCGRDAHPGGCAGEAVDVAASYCPDPGGTREGDPDVHPS